MRLVFVTQAIDADDPNLAATIDKVRALAGRCDSVDVVADRVHAHDLPKNVSFRTFGAPTRLGRGLRYQQALAETLLRPRRDALLAHMVPLYLLLAAPLAKPLRVPLLLWYTHWRADRTLRLADRLCTAALSVDERSYPLRSRKVRGIGHGIDVSRFAPRTDGTGAETPLRFVALGRMARWKGYGTLLDGFELAVSEGLDARLEIRGPSVTPDESRHRDELAGRVAASPRLEARVVLGKPLPRSRIPELLRAADALVTAADSGGSAQTLDKVVYEASACGLPVLASNPALRDHIGALPLRLSFRANDPGDLARALLDFAAAPAERRSEAGRELRRRVEAGHSVDHWADAVLGVVEDLKARKAR